MACVEFPHPGASSATQPPSLTSCIERLAPLARRWSLARRAEVAGVALFAALNLGCASYQGTAKPVQVANLSKQGNWVLVPNFPSVKQSSSHDCGAAALAAVLGYWGRPTTPERVAEAEGRKNQRLRAADLERHAKSVGLSAFVIYGTMADVLYEVRRGRPVIVGVGKPYGENKAIAHYEVVVGYEPKQERVLLFDPAKGFQTNSYEGFATEWAASKGVTIVTFLSESKTATSNR